MRRDRDLSALILSSASPKSGVSSSASGVGSRAARTGTRAWYLNTIAGHFTVMPVLGPDLPSYLLFACLKSLTGKSYL